MADTDLIERLHIERPAWPDPGGELVRYSDHLTALAEKDARIAELELLVASKIKSVRDITIEASRAECEGLRAALKALDAATVSAIHENDKPNRVFFKDGFVLEGRAADEWLRFMHLIQTTCRAALSKKETGNE